MQNLGYLLLLFMIDYGCSEMPQLISIPASINRLRGKSFKYCWVKLGALFSQIISEEVGAKRESENEEGARIWGLSV